MLWRRLNDAAATLLLRQLLQSSPDATTQPFVLDGTTGGAIAIALVVSS